jgi:hypothetical protein
MNQGTEDHSTLTPCVTFTHVLSFLSTEIQMLFYDNVYLKLSPLTNNYL